MFAKVAIITGKVVVCGLAAVGLLSIGSATVKKLRAPKAPEQAPRTEAAS